MLFSSHGRWCSRWGRPRDWLSPSGTFLLTNPLPAVILVSRIPGGRVQYTRHALDRPTAGGVHDLRPLVTPLSTAGPIDRRPRRARVPSRNDEGNREGDCLELARLLKETIPSKETSERRKRRRKYRRRGGRRRRSTQRPTDGVTRTETAGDSRAGPNFRLNLVLGQIQGEHGFLPGGLQPLQVQLLRWSSRKSAWWRLFELCHGAQAARHGRAYPVPGTGRVNFRSGV